MKYSINDLVNMITESVINETLASGSGPKWGSRPVGTIKKGAEINAKRKVGKWIPLEKETSPMTVIIDGKPTHFNNSKEYKKYLEDLKKAKQGTEKNKKSAKKKNKKTEISSDDWDNFRVADSVIRRIVREELLRI